MRPPADLPRVLPLAEASRYGLSESTLRHAVARRGWQRPARGVLFTRPDPLSRDDWIQVGLSLAGRSAAVSGWDAVRSRGVGARLPPSPLALVLTRTGNQRRAAGVMVRPTARPFGSTTLPAEHPTLPFVSVVHPARAIADTALMHDGFMPVRAMVTAAIQRGLCSAEQLVTEYTAGPRGGESMVTHGPGRRVGECSFDR